MIYPAGGFNESVLRALGVDLGALAIATVTFSSLETALAESVPDERNQTRPAIDPEQMQQAYFDALKAFSTNFSRYIGHAHLIEESRESGTDLLGPFNYPFFRFIREGLEAAISFYDEKLKDVIPDIEDKCCVDNAGIILKEARMVSSAFSSIYKILEKVSKRAYHEFTDKAGFLSTRNSLESDYHTLQEIMQNAEMLSGPTGDSYQMGSHTKLLLNKVAVEAAIKYMNQPNTVITKATKDFFISHLEIYVENIFQQDNQRFVGFFSKDVFAVLQSVVDTLPKYGFEADSARHIQSLFQNYKTAVDLSRN